ncbi:APC family permease [Williamsia herbipolensis]|uniref:APC family permease n=1 Tax=Williamsia herbipolensis TaxID=1603258 RepID=A0AAU4JYZ4_9NOCA|nr:APC family permease [Williamsia herbipolensis]
MSGSRTARRAGAAPYGARTPLAGLDRRSLGQAEVAAQSVSLMAPCAAGASVPLLIAQSGAAVVGSLLVAVFLAGLVARVLTEFSSRMAAPGALYTYAAKGLGPAAGFFTAAAMILGYGALAMFTLTESAVYALRAAGVDRPPTAVFVVTLLGFGAASSVVLLRGIRLSARVSLVVEAVAVAILLIVALVVAVSVRGQVDLSDVVVAPSGVTNFAAGVALATCALIGFESAASLSVEARHPLRSVPAAIRGSLVIGAVVVLIATAAQAAGRSAVHPIPTGSNANLDRLVQGIGAGWLAPVVDLGVVASFLACTLACVTALARLLLSLSREGVISSRVGQTHLQRKTPTIAIAASMTVIVTAPVAMALTRVYLGSIIGALATAPVIGFIASYVSVSVAAPVFLRRMGESQAIVTAISTMAAVAFGGIGVTFIVVILDTDWALGALGALGWFAAAAIAYVVYRVRRPAALAGIGIHETPTRSDLWSGHRPRSAPSR